MSKDKLEQMAEQADVEIDAMLSNPEMEAELITRGWLPPRDRLIEIFEVSTGFTAPSAQFDEWASELYGMGLIS